MNFKPIIWTNDLSIIYEIQNFRYDIKLKLLYSNDGIPESIKVIKWEPTLAKATKTDWKCDYVKWGGYPHFVQGDIGIPISKDGREYMFLCTVENHWGDMGNANIFVLLKEEVGSLVPEDFYVEASCA